MSHLEYEDHYYLPNEDYLNQILEMDSSSSLRGGVRDEIGLLKKELSQSNSFSRNTRTSRIESDKKSINDESRLDENGKRKGKWTKEEDDILYAIVPLY